MASVGFRGHVHVGRVRLAHHATRRTIMFTEQSEEQCLPVQGDPDTLTCTCSSLFCVTQAGGLYSIAQLQMECMWVDVADRIRSKKLRG